jgi:hypothetical protein
VIAYSQALWVSTDGIAAPFLTNLDMADELQNFLERENSIPASCFLYRANCLPVLDAWPEDIPSGADWHLWHRIICSNPKFPIVYCRTPSILHFSAKWKKSRGSGVLQLATLLSIADASDWWPSSLRVSMDYGQTEQAAFSSMLSADPRGWSKSVRSAVVDLIARLAWDDLQIVRPTLTTTKEQLFASQAELETAHARLQIAEDDLLHTRATLEVVLAETHRLNERLNASSAEIERRAAELAVVQSSIAWRVHKVLLGLSSLRRGR